LKALADHGELDAILPADGGDCEEVLAQFAKAGIDVDALAAQLQDEGAKSFVKSWNELMAVIASKSAAAQESASELQARAETRSRHGNLLNDRRHRAADERKAWKKLCRPLREGRGHRGGRRERSAAGARGARQDGRLLQSACAAANGWAAPVSLSAT
jgi:biotin-(acetyl-CoA carboxylase) ligase